MLATDNLMEFCSTLSEPAYVFDIDELTAEAISLKKMLPESVGVVYAMKANPFLVPYLTQYADSFEVCSYGEFLICERAGVPMEKVVLSGVYKADDDTERIVKEYGKRLKYTAESPAQLSLLRKLANKYATRLDVLLRLTAGNQFGMDESTVTELVRENCDGDAGKSTGLNIIGIQYYSGTQKKKGSIFKEELEKCDSLLNSITPFLTGLSQETKPYLEYGPGLCVDYFENDKSEEEGVRALTEALCDYTAKYHINLELGRYMAAHCGAYITKIVDIKENLGQKYCIVDGGINHLNYYGQTMAMKIPHILQLKAADVKAASKEGQSEKCKDGSKENAKSGSDKDLQEKCMICGSLCTVSDVLVRGLTLNAPEVKDVLVFFDVGAYSVTEGIYLFLSHNLPQIYEYRDGKYTLIREALPTHTLNFIYDLT